MFLPRRTSFQADQRPKLGRSPSSSSLVSLHVHQSILAGRARELSTEHGLGLADYDRDSIEDDGSQSNVDQRSTRAPGPLSRSSFRRLPQSTLKSTETIALSTEPQSGIVSAPQHTTSSDNFRRSIDQIFVGARSTSHQHPSSSLTTDPDDAPKSKRHSTKRASLRGYAEARWRKQEGIHDRILKATNVHRLEWEAKAALLHQAYSLAILLLYRAGMLASPTACTALARLYAMGVIRGNQPVVALIYRDSLRSIAWSLESLRLYDRRLSAQIRAARSSPSPSYRLLQVWQGPLEAVHLLTRALLASDVQAFSPNQKNALFLPRLADLADSQAIAALRQSNATKIGGQPLELWTEVEDVSRRLTARVEAETAVKPSLFAHFLSSGPDEEEEDNQLARDLQTLRFHALVLQAILTTRRLALEPYLENLDAVEKAWSAAEQAIPTQGTSCIDIRKLLEIITSSKQEPKSLSNGQLFHDLSAISAAELDEMMVPSYQDRAKYTTAAASDAPLPREEHLLAPPKAVEPRRYSLRDLVPEDVETVTKKDASVRPALTLRLSSSHAAPQASIANIFAEGGQQHSREGGLSDESRQRLGRAISSTLIATSANASSSRPSHRTTSAEPSSPSDSVRTGFNLGVGRPRRPSSVVSVTPSLLFPPGASEDDSLESEDPVVRPSAAHLRATSASMSRSRTSSHIPAGSTARPQLVSGGSARPRVMSMYSSPSMMTASSASYTTLTASASTSSQQSLHALAAANQIPSFLTAAPPSRRRTGSNASLTSINSRMGHLISKTSPSIAEMPEVLSFVEVDTRTSADVAARGEMSASSRTKKGASDTLRGLKGRQSSMGLRSTHQQENAAEIPPAPPTTRTEAATSTPAFLKPSRSTVFVSVENLSGQRSPDSLSPSAENLKLQTGRRGSHSAIEHLQLAHSRIPHAVIPSVLEEAEVAPVRSSTGGPSFTTALIAGAMSGLTVDLLFFPIDTIKTRLQSSQGFWAAGGFSGVYRGLASTAVGSAPGASVFFTTYESMKPSLGRWFPSMFGADGYLGPAGLHMASASIAEVAACLIRVPTEVIKSRQQASVYGRNTTTLQAFKVVFQESGIRGYYRGFGSTVGREIPFTCIQFPLYEKLKLEMAKSNLLPDASSTSRAKMEGTRLSNEELVRNLPTWQAGLAGSVAGAIAAGLTTPLDVVKTRIMLHTKKAAAGTAAAELPWGVNTKIYPTLVHIARTEGVKTLFSGFVPRTMWIGLGGAVFLGTFDAGTKALS